MPVKEEDVPKIAFRSGSFGLYEFSWMPFGLSNSGSSFFHLMEMCLGDQHFLTLLLHLDNICIFATSIDEMLGRIELVFERPRAFNPKPQAPKSHFFQSSVVFLRCAFCGRDFCKSKENRESAELPTTKKFLFRPGFIWLAVHTKICYSGKVFAPTDRTNKWQETHFLQM